MSQLRLGAIWRPALLALTVGAMLAAAPGARPGGSAEAAPPEPVDLLFATPHLGNAKPGAVIGYAHTRRTAHPQRLGADFDRRITVATGTEADPATRIVLDAEGTPRHLDPFRGVPGNPLLMVFLENTVRAVSQATGGSPFYLRNRIREALGDRLSSQPMILAAGNARLPARSLSVRPFEGDENAERMGPFASIELRFVVAEAAPGMLVAMTADVGPRIDPQTGATTGAGSATGEPIYFEEIRLDPKP
ncbi:MAG: hypothetical protein AAF371_03445 [Pseudomonadota bacterium]